jgi:hypothetical protein
MPLQTTYIIPHPQQLRTLLHLPYYTPPGASCATPAGAELCSFPDMDDFFFVRRFALQARKSVTKAPVRLSNGQRVTSSTVCDVTFELARHEFTGLFTSYMIYVLLI